MILAIDAGNSRTKWGVFDEAGELKAHGIIPNSAISGIPLPVAWKPCKRAVISNVGGERLEEGIRSLLDTLNISARWIKATVQACGVANSYQRPELLGADRWAALIAAWRHYNAPCVVINAGTALTVDALGIGQDGKGIFLGGLIVPGLRLMGECLVKGTAGISHASGTMQYFPTNTGDAIYTGALSAMAGAVNSVIVKLELQAKQKPHCVVSGGDAVILAEMLERYELEKLVIADNLVLQGLLFLGEEMGTGQ